MGCPVLVVTTRFDGRQVWTPFWLCHFGLSHYVFDQVLFTLPVLFPVCKMKKIMPTMHCWSMHKIRKYKENNQNKIHSVISDTK